MSGVRLVVASRAHVRRIARRMREIDRAEAAAFGHSPEAALRDGLARSAYAVTVFVDDSPHAMMGVSPVGSLANGVGRPWFLGSDLTYSRGRELLRLGPVIVADMHVGYRRLENVVSAANGRAILLLRRLGFKVGSEIEMIGGVSFLPFWMGADHV